MATPRAAPATPAAIRRSRTITFTVEGTPQPKGSSRALHNRDGSVRVFSDNARLRQWEDAVRFAAKLWAKGAFFATGTVALIVEFYLDRPPSVVRPHPSVKPDLSKLVRGIEDALTGLVFRDDAQITSIMASKNYCTPPATARALITLTGWVDETPGDV